MTERPSPATIPTSFLWSKKVDLGWLPDTGVRRSSSIVIQSTSRSVWVMATFSVMLTVPVIVLLPIPIEGRIGVALILLVGGISAAIAVPIMRSRYGVTLIADRTRPVIEIHSGGSAQQVAWSSIIGLQVLQPSRRSRGRRACQLNLVYWGADGEVNRLNLYSSAIAFYVKRIAARYESFTGWKIFSPDESTCLSP